MSRPHPAMRTQRTWATLMNHASFEHAPQELLDWINQNPRAAGKRLERFVHNGLPEMDPPSGQPERIWPEPNWLLRRLRELLVQIGGYDKVVGALDRLAETEPPADDGTETVAVPEVFCGSAADDLKLIQLLIRAADAPIDVLIENEIGRMQYIRTKAPKVGARWVVLDLSSNTNRSTDQIRGSTAAELLPTTSVPLVWVLASKAVTAFRDKTGIWAMDIPGYHVPGHCHASVPYLRWPPGYRRARLDAGRSDFADREFCVPVVRE